MAKRQYHIVDGRVIGETSAGVRTDYLRDALGSVTGRVNESAVAINTFRYKPSGEELSETGPASSTPHRWKGHLGWRVVRTSPKFIYGPIPPVVYPSLGSAISPPYNPQAITVHDAEIDHDTWDYRICDGSEFCIRFKSPTRQTFRGKGAIVQFVKGSLTSTNCRNPTDITVNKVEHWEAWEFNDGKYVPPKEKPNKQPWDCFTGLIGGDCFKGRYTAHGKLAYYHNFDARAAGFSYDPFLELLTRKTDPGLPPALQSHSHEFLINCCQPDKVLFSATFYSGPYRIRKLYLKHRKGSGCTC